MDELDAMRQRLDEAKAHAAMLEAERDAVLRSEGNWEAREQVTAVRLREAVARAERLECERNDWNTEAHVQKDRAEKTEARAERLADALRSKPACTHCLGTGYAQQGGLSGDPDTPCHWCDGSGLSASGRAALADAPEPEAGEVEGPATKRAGLFTCSFCGRPDNETGRLIAGPDVYICAECISLCVMAFAEAPEPKPCPECERLRRALRDWKDWRLGNRLVENGSIHLHYKELELCDALDDASEAWHEPTKSEVPK